MKRFFLSALLICAFSLVISAQIADSCKLNFGTNLAGFTDWGTEIPLKDMMKSARVWYTKDVDNPSAPWNSENPEYLEYRSDGYPTHTPQTIDSSEYRQTVATIWAITDAWKPGEYVVLYEGTGEIRFHGGMSNVTQTDEHRITFQFPNPVGTNIEMIIDSSAIDDPIRNIRIIHADYEDNFEDDPFNPDWIEKLMVFNSVRFMDWGQTNNWGEEGWPADDTTLFSWNERTTPDYYTYAMNKGVPYELMIQLLNMYDLDGWVCVPHRASNEYIREMANLFFNTLEPERTLTVEYSNEIWNWMFLQTQWLNEFGCIQQDISWPEGIVPYIQNCLDIWSAVYSNEMHRIVRAVGIQTSWLDVSQRIVFNLADDSFDAVAPTYYFGLTGEADATLDAMEESATVDDIASLIREYRADDVFAALLDVKEHITDSLDVPMAFYEGGQHITPHPFGEEPTYAQALLDIQRDTAMYNLYNEMYSFMRTLNETNEPFQCMNFSFIGGRSARYGSWGILESLNQDTTEIYAPKYSATLHNQFNGCFTVTNLNETHLSKVSFYPNPACDVVHFEGDNIIFAEIVNSSGQVMRVYDNITNNNIHISNLPNGVYILRLQSSTESNISFKLIKHN
jgi:hypothetical protein